MKNEKMEMSSRASATTTRLRKEVQVKQAKSFSQILPTAEVIMKRKKASGASAKTSLRSKTQVEEEEQY